MMRRKLRVWLWKQRAVLALAAAVGLSGLVHFRSEFLPPPQPVGGIMWKPAPREQGPPPTEYVNGPHPRWVIDGALAEAGPYPHREGMYFGGYSYYSDLQYRPAAIAIPTYSVVQPGFYSVGDEYRRQFVPQVVPVFPRVIRVQPFRSGFGSRDVLPSFTNGGLRGLAGYR